MALIELAARLIRRCRWSLRRLRQTASMHVAHRRVSRSHRKGALRLSLSAWMHVHLKLAQTLDICHGIWRQHAKVSAFRKLVRLFLTQPRLLSARLKLLVRRGRMARILLNWRRQCHERTADAALRRISAGWLRGRAMAAWREAFKARFSSRSLRRRVVRREMTPVFNTWRAKVSFFPPLPFVPLPRPRADHPHPPF